ncbi:hypothetical protein AAG906_028222 [Vitis piasezkii]
MEDEMFCYIHEGGELVKTAIGSIEYKGGRTNCIVVSKNILHSEFVSKVCGELNLEPNSIKLDFTVKFDPSCLLPLHDDADIVKMFKFNDMFCHAYVFQCIEGGDGFIGPTSAPTPIVASNSAHVSSIGEPLLHMSNELPTIESFGFSQRCAETNIIQLERSRFEHSIIDSGHTFPNASEFRDAIYLMSLHMSKLGSMLVKYKEESNNWKWCIDPKIEDKVLQNIAKGEVYPVTMFMNGVFGVCIGRALLNVNIMNCTCTCRGWQMLGIPCQHATVVIISIGQNVIDFIDDCYKYLMQELIYGGFFSDTETHDMPSVEDDGLVRSITREVFFSLKPPHAKCHPGRPRKKRIESQFQDKRTVYCSRCHMFGHNRKMCRNPLP